MRYLRAFCRVVFALTFILSGILKLMDPIGTGLIVKEYFDFLHLGFLEPLAVAAGIGLSTLEFTVGVSVLLGLQMNFFAWVGLVMTSVFTLLTLYLAIFNPISDCGCFGEAIHLTNTQTFLKNLVLLALILVIFFGRKKATKIAPGFLQWIFVGLFALLGASISLHTVTHIPLIDFTAYRVGTNLADTGAGQARYETVFVYEKDGVEKTFALEDIPDESWTFVDSETKLIEGSTKMAQVDFELDRTEGPLFAVTVYDPDRISEKRAQQIRAFCSRVALAGGEARVYGPSYDYEYVSDRKSLMTLNRSNGGVVFFYDGVIVRKWCARHIDRIDAARMLGSDPDVVVIKQRIGQQFFVSSLLLGILVLVLVLRYLCRMFSK